MWFQGEKPGRITSRNVKSLIKSKKKVWGRGETPKQKTKREITAPAKQNAIPGAKVWGSMETQRGWRGCAAKVRIARVEPRSTDSFPFQPERSRDPYKLEVETIGKGLRPFPFM